MPDKYAMTKANVRAVRKLAGASRSAICLGRLIGHILEEPPPDVDVQMGDVYGDVGPPVEGYGSLELAAKLWEEGLDRVLQANCHARWAAGGTPNAVKLKGFSLRLEGGDIRYEPGVWDSFLGPVKWKKEGLSMTGIPVVQLEAPTDKLRRMEKSPSYPVCAAVPPHLLDTGAAYGCCVLLVLC